MIIKVDGMSCKHCEKRVTETLRSLGLRRIKIDLQTKEVAFRNKKNVELDKIKEAIEEIGFKVI